MGLEVAQANAAYMLEQGGAWYESADRLARVLYYHRLAADQGNVKSLLQIGDAYYYGRAVQVDRIQPVVKAPGIKRLKLTYDEPP